LLVTEMISSEAIQHKKPQRIIETFDSDRPVAFQISGHKPELMLKSALKLINIADIIDINMGCPAPKIVKNGDGAALMKTPEIASNIVKTISKAIEKPVSIKMRIGWDFNSINGLDFAKKMEDSGASLITVHGRTRSQFYSGSADWEQIAKIKQAISIPVIANGDIISPETAKKCLRVTGCDGIAIGRGLLGNPWLLYRIDHYFKTGEILPEPSIVDRLDMALFHCQQLINFIGGYHGLCHSRKHFGWYIKYIPGAPGYRDKLNRQETYENVKAIINEIKEKVPFEHHVRQYKNLLDE